MENKFNHVSETISMFCRRYIYAKRNLPIRHSEMGVLIFTAKSTEPVTAVVLSELLCTSKPNITSKINVLRDMGYLEKVQCATDKRSYFLKLTAKGEAVVNETASEYLKLITFLSDNMGLEDFEKLYELLQKANAVLREYN